MLHTATPGAHSQNDGQGGGRTHYGDPRIPETKRHSQEEGKEPPSRYAQTCQQVPKAHDISEPGQIQRQGQQQRSGNDNDNGNNNDRDDNNDENNVKDDNDNDNNNDNREYNDNDGAFPCLQTTLDNQDGLGKSW
jgi:hypothetical protein